MWAIFGYALMAVSLAGLAYVFFFQDIGHWLYEKIIVNQWDARFRNEYRLFHPKSTFAQEAHHKLDYGKIQAMEKEIFGKCWHGKNGEYHPYPFLYKDLPMRDYEKYSYYRDDNRKHFCTDVPDTLKPCEECASIHRYNETTREASYEDATCAYQSRWQRFRDYWDYNPKSKPQVYGRSVRASKNKKFEKERDRWGD